MNHTKPEWSDSERDEVVRRWNSGESGAEIGRSYGLSRNAIIGRLDRLRKYGMFIRAASDTPYAPKPEKKAPIPKEPKADIKRRKSPVNRVDKGIVPAAWKDDETDLLVDKWNQGMGEAALAKLLGRTLCSIRARVARMVSLGRCHRGSQRSTKLARPISFAPPYAAKRDENRISLFTAHGRGAVQAFEEKMPGAGVSIMQLSRFSCRFVTGADLFCGEKVQKGSYCEACRPRVYLGAA